MFYYVLLFDILVKFVLYCVIALFNY